MSDCVLVPLPDGTHTCEACGFTRRITVAPERYHRRCPGRPGSPAPAAPAGKPCGTCGPGLLRTAANAVAAAGRVVGAVATGQPVLVDAATKAARLAVCGRCELLAGNRCDACGCFVEAKAALATEDCPKGRWPLRVFWRYPHGLGDHVQLTVALRHIAAVRPGWRIHLACKPGMEALFTRYPQVTLLPLDARPGTVDHIDEQVYREPAATYADSPATKSEQFLRSIGITPRLDLCRYTCDPSPVDWLLAERFAREVDAPYLLLHTGGHSNRAKKNLPLAVGQAAIDWARASGLRVVLLDWEAFSPQLHAQCVHPGRGHWLWEDARLGTAGAIAALAGKAAICVGIDSGPGHVFGAMDTPAVIYWGRHHPVNYYGLSPNVTHMIPPGVHNWIKGDKPTGKAFFLDHYRHVEYIHAAETLPQVLDAIHARV